MSPSFIIVNKVVSNNKSELSAQPERIRLDEIKSYRKWNKTDAEMVAFKEDITIVYMRNKEVKDDKVTAIKIAESLKDFDKRMGQVISLNVVMK